MSNEEILKLAIQKALDNGFSWSTGDWKILNKPIKYDDSHVFTGWSVTAYSIIFSHDFAKAFFGEGWLHGHGEHIWKVRLKEMVLQEHPIKYLEQFLTHPL